MLNIAFSIPSEQIIRSSASFVFPKSRPTLNKILKFCFPSPIKREIKKAFFQLEPQPMDGFGCCEFHADRSEGRLSIRNLLKKLLQHADFVSVVLRLREGAMSIRFKTFLRCRSKFLSFTLSNKNFISPLLLSLSSPVDRNKRNIYVFE